MYRTCIFCSKDLGSNEVIEHFPVGGRIAFDGFKGRLWAICPRCGRWNLAPIEERWEAVEEAEARFRDARKRVQSENIGMARLPDGTQLVRIGSALPGELAAWRYGSELVKRRRNMYVGIGAGVLAGGVIVAGLPLIGAAVPFTMINPVIQGVSGLARYRAAQRVVLNVDASESPTGQPLLLRQRHLLNSRLESVDGALGLSIPEPGPRKKWHEFDNLGLTRGARAGEHQHGPRMTLSGKQAELVAARAMIQRNAKGASAKAVSDALDVLHRAGSAQEYLSSLALKSPTIVSPTSFRRSGPSAMNPRVILGTFRGQRVPTEEVGLSYVKTYVMQQSDALALEMALHEESERRAMEGELEQLEDAWREAEEIARIADALPGEPPE